MSIKNSLALAQCIAEAAIEKKASDVVILDLTKLDSVTDYFVICTGEVNQQVKAIINHIEREVRAKLHERALHREGYEALNWVLLDYINVVVHVFKPSFREFYRLEDLWSDAKVMVVEDKAAAAHKRATAPQKGAKAPVKKSSMKSATAKPKKRAIKSAKPRKRSR